MAYNTLTEREAFYCLCHVPGFGSATIGKLRERFGTYQEVWTAKEQEIQKAGVLTEKRVTVFLQAREQESAWLKEFYGLERTGIRFIAEGDTDYPERFLPYKDRPAALFVKGNLPGKRGPGGCHCRRQSLHGIWEGGGRILCRGTCQCGSQHYQRHGGGSGWLCPQGRDRARETHLRGSGMRGKYLLSAGKLQKFFMPWRKTAVSSQSSSRGPALWQ